MKILFIGDIFGKPGRKMIQIYLQKIIKEQQIDLVIANAENAANGKGLTWKIYYNLQAMGINYFTMGNHTWSKDEGIEILAKQKNIIRPINLADHFPYANIGNGSIVFLFQNKKIRITNIMGQSVNFYNTKTTIPYILNPFIYLKKFLENHQDQDIHIIDFHCETTSEKNAMLRAFNGSVDAILGTHTHVPTNDFQIYNQTAYITDVGMTGPFEGIIGGKKEMILDKFFERCDFFKLNVQPGLKQFCSVILEFDEKNKINKFYPLIIREDLSSGLGLIYFYPFKNA